MALWQVSTRVGYKIGADNLSAPISAFDDFTGT